MSRTGHSLKNIKFVLIFQAATALVSFFTRKVFVLVLTKEYLGLNGTFANILSMLSLAELGVGNAITYSLYKPLAEDDREQVTALMALYRRVYRVIGAVVALLGAALMPALPVLIRDLPEIPHIYLIYLLFVLNSTLSYFYAYKQSLIIASQRQYIATICHNGLRILLLVAQAGLLLLTGNYFVYLGLQIGVTLLEGLILSRQADRLYPYGKTGRPGVLNPDTKKEIVRNVKALMVHQMGGIVVFGTDNLMISFFSGAVAVGLYSNYLMVTNCLNSLYGQLFRSLIASVGNLGVKEGPERALPVFWRVSLFGSWLYGFSAVCLAVLLNPFIALWVGADYQLSQGIVWLIALDFYVTGMRKAVLTFREAYGLYWYDRYKPVAECMINLTASAVLAVPFGIAGILAGTFISTMATCFWVEPVILFQHGFQAPVGRYFREYALNTLVTVLSACLVWQICALIPGGGLLSLLGKAGVCAVAGNLGYLAVYCRREEFRYFLQLARRCCGR